FRMFLGERRRYEHLMAIPRERLGAAYEAEHRAGAGLTLEQAVAEARLRVPAGVAHHARATGATRKDLTEGAAMTSTTTKTTTDMTTRSADAWTHRVTAENGIEYAYRDLGGGDVPLVLLQHFRGNLDNWDPSLVDALAADRRVVAFDNVGVG